MQQTVNCLEMAFTKIMLQLISREGRYCGNLMYCFVERGNGLKGTRSTGAHAHKIPFHS